MINKADPTVKRTLGISAVSLCIVLALIFTLSLLFGNEPKAEQTAELPDTLATPNEAEGEAPYLRIIASNMKYKDRFYIDYAVATNLGGITDPSEIKMLFWTEPSGEYTAEAKTHSYIKSPEKKSTDEPFVLNGNTYPTYETFCSEGIAAKEMCDNIYARAYLTDKEGRTYYSNAVKYSVLEYVLSRFADFEKDPESVSADQMELYNNILRYGAGAQVLLEHNTDRLPISGAVRIKLEGGVLSDGFASGVFFEGESAVITALDRSTPVYWLSSKGEPVSKEMTFTLNVTKDTMTETYTAVNGDAEAYIEKRWEIVGEEIGDPEVTAALRDFYTLYDGEKIINWLVSLYDPDICVCTGINGNSSCQNTPYCHTGGFYFCTASRDAKGYLPDAESTAQALSLLSRLSASKLYADAIPENMAEKICGFINSLKADDGFYYHPQWKDKTLDSSRKERDKNAGDQILTNLAAFNTQSASGLKAPLTARAVSSVSAVSKVIAVASASDGAPDLSSPENFRAWLHSQDINNNSYSVGDKLSSHGELIKSKGQEYGDVLIAFLNETQNPDNGTWNNGGTVSYDDINGVMKISGSYQRWGMEIPNAEKTLKSAFSMITSNLSVTYVVDVWNAWEAVNGVLNNVSEETASALRASLSGEIAAAIRSSKEKLSSFKHSDGSFSYNIDYASDEMSGMPIAPSGSNAGDMNATVIAVSYMIGSLYDFLGLDVGYEIPVIGIEYAEYFDNAISSAKHYPKK